MSLNVYVCLCSSCVHCHKEQKKKLQLLQLELWTVWLLASLFYGRQFYVGIIEEFFNDRHKLKILDIHTDNRKFYEKKKSLLTFSLSIIIKPENLLVGMNGAREVSAV